MKFKLAIILCVIIILTACSSIPGYNKFFDGGISGGAGKGITVKFVQAPQEGSILGEEDQFSVAIEVYNYIASDRGVTGFLCLRQDASSSIGGVPPNECRNLNLQPAEDIDGNVYPDQGKFFFPDQGYYSYRRLDQFKQQNQLHADLLYEVDTTAGAIACVSMPQAEKVPSACKGRQTISLQQQEAPIQIVDLTAEQMPSGAEGVRLKLEMKVKKVDTGEIIAPGKLMSAAATPIVRFQASVNRMPLSCQGVAGSFIEFRSNQNEKVIKCTAPLKLTQSYENIPLSFELEYGFKKTIPGPRFELRKEDYIA